MDSMTNDDRNELLNLLRGVGYNLGLAIAEAEEGQPLLHGCCGYCGWNEELCPGAPEYGETGCRPEGTAAELARCVIRILNYLESMGLDAAALLTMVESYERKQKGDGEVCK